MNSDQLLRNLDDCAQASTHEPDAETINAAVEYIMQLERENHNQDLTIDEKNERIAQLEAQLTAVERDAWNAAIDCVAKVIENVPYADEKTVEIAKQSAQVARTFKK